MDMDSMAMDSMACKDVTMMFPGILWDKNVEYHITLRCQPLCMESSYKKKSSTINERSMVSVRPGLLKHEVIPELLGRVETGSAEAPAPEACANESLMKSSCR